MCRAFGPHVMLSRSPELTDNPLELFQVMVQLRVPAALGDEAHRRRVDELFEVELLASAERRHVAVFMLRG